jgi:very-short-patch-repair endonuclease
MRKDPTPAEARMETLLLRLLPGRGQVERQFAFGAGSKRYILDFYLPEIGLGIEVDGAHHGTPEQKKIDKAKEQVARDRGILICRIANKKCLASSETELTEWVRQAWRRAAKAYPRRKSSG